jgi:hypothetical protein
MRSLAAIMSFAMVVCACGEERVDPIGAGGAGGGTVTTTGASTTTIGVGGSGQPLTPLFSVDGIVLDQNGAAVEGAFVLQGGKSHLPPLLTGPSGTFSVELSYEGMGIPAVVATKAGYRTRGHEFTSLPTGPVELVLYAAEGPDNLSYTYGAPGEGDDPTTAFCGHCHVQITQEFQRSKHAKAASNSLVQDLYAGVASAITSAAACQARGGVWRTGLVPGSDNDTAARCYLGFGVLPDLNGCGGPGDVACDNPALSPNEKPSAFGACADCHAPGIVGIAGGRDLLAATGLAYEHGVFCEPCHKAADVDLTKAPGAGGALMIMRPAEAHQTSPGTPWRQVMYGPLLDVANPSMGGSYQPKFARAEFCAACHEQKQPALLPGESLDPSRWPEGLPVHSTYSEWLAGPYGASETPCQHCHMPPNFSLQSSADLGTTATSSITFGFVRPPTQIRQHTFRGPLGGDDSLLAQSAFVHIAATPEATAIATTVSISNVGCGHALPTGEPMRALVLLVEAEACGQILAPVSGSSVDDLGGALATGVVGDEVTAAGLDLIWPDNGVEVGDVVRAVRPSGAFEDYPGIGFCAEAGLAAADKGRPLREPLGEAVVVAVAGEVVSLTMALPLVAGDVVFVGESPSLVDGGPARAYAGHAGSTFGRVLLDAQGRRQVPHHRAIDIASDNRIPPGGSTTTSHGFALPADCSFATIRARLLYRPLPLAEARLRAWAATDHLVAAAEHVIPLR